MTTSYYKPGPMNTENGTKTLGRDAYPGRGIIVGLNRDGSFLLQVYWVMGRSANSRNRLLKLEAGTVKTVPYDASAVEDPSLIIYNAMRSYEGHHVVSNGDHTDTIISYLRRSQSVERAMRTRTYEPDAPNYTPRIAAAVSTGTSKLRYTLAIIRRETHTGEPSRRYYIGSLAEASPGTGFCLHTYRGDGNPLPPFIADPYPVPLGNDEHDTADMYWDLLAGDNLVALAVKRIGLRDGTSSYAIRNRLPAQDG